MSSLQVLASLTITSCTMNFQSETRTLLDFSELRLYSHIEYPSPRKQSTFCHFWYWTFILPAVKKWTTNLRNKTKLSFNEDSNTWGNHQDRNNKYKARRTKQPRYLEQHSILVTKLFAWIPKNRTAALAGWWSLVTSKTVPSCWSKPCC